MKFTKKINKITITIVICITLILIPIVVYMIRTYLNKQQNIKIIDELNKIKIFTKPDGSKINLSCEPLADTKRVYVSAGMFDLTDNIYSIGIGGLSEGKGFSAMAFPEVLCNFTTEQTKELKQLCTTWNVPWNGIVGEIEKMGWEAYCPVRDGFVMAPTIQSVANMTIKDLYKNSDNSTPDKNSMFNKNTIVKNIKLDLEYQNLLKIEGIKIDLNNITDNDCLDYIKNFLIQSISISIGANDLFAMYSSCNCCVFNENGIQADSGGLAELGNLGARGVPITILKGQITADFGGNNNPMPTMSSSAESRVFPSLTTNKNSIYKGLTGALNHLEDKINTILNNKNNIYAYGDCNLTLPLPPLQAYWSSIGALSYFIKHNSKSIKTIGNGTGHIDYDKDYTPFWKNKVVNATDKNAGFLAFGKKCGENLYWMQQQKQWQDVKKIWT